MNEKQTTGHTEFGRANVLVILSQHAHNQEIAPIYQGTRQWSDAGGHRAL
jgi:hypothetical protein